MSKTLRLDDDAARVDRPRRSTALALPALVLGVLLVALLFPSSTLAQNADCGGGNSSFLKGTCAEYSGFCAGISGNSIFINSENDDVSKHEALAAEGIRLIRQNAGLVSAQCEFPIEILNIAPINP